MSASPSGFPGGSLNGAAAPAFRRRRPQGNPLVAKQRAPPKSKALQRPQPAASSNGAHSVGKPGNLAVPAARSAPHLSHERLSRPQGATSFLQRPRSTSPEGNLCVYPVFAVRRGLHADLRHHAARLTSKSSLEITNQEHFKRPLYLHRRDPRATVGGGNLSVDSKEEAEAEEERQRIEAYKLERQRVREENAKLIAPGVTNKKKPQAFKKKVEQVYRTDETPEDRKRNQLRYEEALPWFLEEMDGKNVWQGTYEAALSESHVLLMENEGDSQPSYYVTPLEKWYKFRERNKFKHLDIEEAEERMGSKVKEPRWFQVKKQEMKEVRVKDEQNLKSFGLFQRSGGKEEKPSVATSGEFGDRPDAVPDADDIDFNYEEEFADDEENALFEGDDETQRMAEERIKRDQLAANVFGMTDEKEVEEEAEREKKLKLIQKQLEKGTKKALIKREKNFDYESDSDANPYTEESESEDSDAERAKEEERKKEDDVKSQEKSKQKGKDADKPASGASTRGSNTPSSRKEKHVEPFRRTAASVVSTLKRPGSPNLSEASGNESSRKKIKKKHITAQGGTSTPRPGGSPLPESAAAGLLDRSRQASFAGTLRGAGSGSDTDGTNGGRTKLKISMRGSPNGSPNGSRATSPARPVKNGSTAGSLNAGAATPPASQGNLQSSIVVLPTKEEILANIPAEGVDLKTLLPHFRTRIPAQNKEATKEFIALVKSLTNFHPQTRLLTPKRT